MVDQELDGLRADDGDQLGPVVLLVDVLCQTGAAWHDTKATLTAGNLNSPHPRGRFAMVGKNKRAKIRKCKRDCCF